MTSIGQKIKSTREDQGLTQETLAEKAHISRQGLSELENNHREPTLRVLRKIARALEVDLLTFWPEDE